MMVAVVVVTPGMFLADFTTASSTFSVMTMALPSTPIFFRNSAKGLVLISSTFRPSMTRMLSSAALALSALFRARRRVFLVRE